MKKEKKDIFHLLVLVMIAVQPVIDLDYLFYDFLDRFGLPRFSTVVRFLVLPAMILYSFIRRDKHKKRTFLAALVYGVFLLGYFFLHNRQASALADHLGFTGNFVYRPFQELTYILTLVIPFGIVYLVYNEHFRMEALKKICLFESVFVSALIVFGDLFVFGRSTYYGYTVGNIFSWFTGVYDWYHPRTLAAKFFFQEGNTIGILLFLLLLFLYYFLEESQERKEKKQLAAVIFIQSLAMVMLATRVATYGTAVIPILFLVLYLVSVLLKQKKLKRWAVVIPAVFSALFFAVLDFTPAIQNQKVDAVNDVALLHNGMAELGEAELKNAEDLVPGTPEYINFYVYMFETYGINARYIQSVPSMYYTEYYSYQFDPKFWVDVTFMPVFDRVSGRQIETIFFNYKYSSLSPAEKILGMGYSTFMNGSIVLEQDFKQQVYTLGYAGTVLCVLPWICLVFYGLLMFLRKWNRLFTLDNLIPAAMIALAFGTGWMSGHVLDQFVTTAMMALLTGFLLNRVQEEK